MAQYYSLFCDTIISSIDVHPADKITIRYSVFFSSLSPFAGAITKSKDMYYIEAAIEADKV